MGADSPRNGSPQNRERKGSHEKAQDWQEVLLPGTVEPRCGLEVPGRHRDFGGQEEGQGRRLPQQKRHQGQGCCRRREGSCCTDQTNHRTDCSIWCRLISSSFFLEKYITL